MNNTERNVMMKTAYSKKTSFSAKYFKQNTSFNRLRNVKFLYLTQNEKCNEQGTRWPYSAATYSCWFLASGFFYPEDGGDTFLRNVGSHKIYMVPHPRRRHSSNRIEFNNLEKGRSKKVWKCFSTAWFVSRSTHAKHLYHRINALCVRPIYA
jgi:hypothetical protein